MIHWEGRGLLQTAGVICEMDPVACCCGSYCLRRLINADAPPLPPGRRFVKEVSHAIPLWGIRVPLKFALQ